MISKHFTDKHAPYYCRDFTQIENYEKAVADETRVWDCHHRLETHTSDGERRLVDISTKELKALGVYYARPPEELIFMTQEEHHRLHRHGKKLDEETINKRTEKQKGAKRSDETKRRLSESNRNNPKQRCKKVRCIETNTVYPSIREAGRATDILHGNIKNVCHGKQLTAGGYHWEFV